MSDRSVVEARCGLSWPPWVEVAGLGLVLLSTFLLYAGALEGFFVQDDYGWLLNTRFESLSDYWKSFSRFNAWGSYRPLSQETFFWLGQKAFGLTPTGFHAVSIVIHLIDATLVFVLLRRFNPPLPSLAGTLFFSTHGAHFTSVYWISALPEPLALMFLLASLLLFMDFDRRENLWTYILSLVAMALGMMCKESVLPLPLILAAYCALLAPRRAVLTIPYFAISCAYLLARAASTSVQAAPYALTFGEEAIHNLASYLSWSFGVTQTFLKHITQRDAAGLYPLLGALSGMLILLLVCVSNHRRLALFCLGWFFASLQPVLYFSGHIYPYYLGPSLAALSLLIASALPPLRDTFGWKGWLPAVTLGALSVSIAAATIVPEGRWWIGRSLERRDFLESMKDVNERVPEGQIAMVIGLDQSKFEVFENGSAFRAFGIAMEKFHFVLPGLEANLDGLASSARLETARCFVYASGVAIDRTREFRENPEAFLTTPAIEIREREGIRLEVSPASVRRGLDTLELRAVNLKVPAMDVLYSVDGRMMPPVVHWLLDADQRATVFVDISTQKGLYRFLAIRDSRNESTDRWIRVDASVRVE